MSDQWEDIDATIIKRAMMPILIYSMAYAVDSPLRKVKGVELHVAAHD